MLVPTLCPGDIIVMNNLSVHKASDIRQRIEHVASRRRTQEYRKELRETLEARRQQRANATQQETNDIHIVEPDSNPMSIREMLEMLGCTLASLVNVGMTGLLAIEVFNSFYSDKYDPRTSVRLMAAAITLTPTTAIAVATGLRAWNISQRA